MTLLGAAEIREIAAELDLHPAKSLGQNFVIDGNTCRKIVRLAEVTKSDHVIEIGPGIGSLTIALLEVAQSLTAIEIDQRLAAKLSSTVATHLPDSKLEVINRDALSLNALDSSPTVLVANLPYNISVPVLLHYLEHFPSIKSGVVMVQAEVADRLAAQPNTREYGIPSVKASWWAELKLVGSVSRSVFWPVPNVDSKLVRFVRREVPGDEALRIETFAAIDSAFAQRRKMLRSALSNWAGSSAEAAGILSDAAIDPTLRGEALTLRDFCAIGKAKLAKNG
ncbi:MAG: 16S rRNA (adenine(1518)-N(6)/adenine(1519)-N(6))-dimethyltransferase RsmA [Actinomycetes bacterium]